MKRHKFIYHLTPTQYMAMRLLMLHGSAGVAWHKYPIHHLTIKSLLRVGMIDGSPEYYGQYPDTVTITLDGYRSMRSFELA